MKKTIKINEKNLKGIISNCVKNVLAENSNFNNYPDKFYHATISSNINSIKRYGLGGKISKTRFWDYENTVYEHIKKGVFLTDDPGAASDFIEASDVYDDLTDENDNIEIIVFEIDINDIDINKLQKDQNMNSDDDFTWFYNGVIPYNKLKIVDLY